MIGTDGLFDNMFDQQIMEIIKPFVDTEDSNIDDPILVAETIAAETEKHSQDPDYLSPFAEGAKEYYEDYLGGKEDDITLAVA